MPTREDRYHREQEHRDRYAHAAAELRRYAEMRTVAEPVLPLTVRKLILSAAVVCEGVSRFPGTKEFGPVLAQGIDGIATAAATINEPSKPPTDYQVHGMGVMQAGVPGIGRQAVRQPGPGA